MSRTSRIWLVPVCSVAALLMLFGLADAHDFWLVPNAFQVGEGAAIEVNGQTSSRFPKSESAVTPDRVSEARILGPAPESDVRITDVSTSGTSLMLRHRPRALGQRVVAVTVGWRSVRASGPGFKRYIELEGNPALAARYERAGLLPKTDSITRRYAKYAKTFVEVGRGGPRAFSRVVGHPLEFVPLRDPASLRSGDTLSLRVLYNTQPLRDVHIHAGVAADITELKAVSLGTDADGVVRVPITGPGLWNVRTLHVVPTPSGSNADWESHFATLVFRAEGTSATSDSAQVVEVVRGYGEALARGDSARALQLLTPDAVILESGGIELLSEYRAHHLPADIAFAAGVLSQRSLQRVSIRGDVAWVASTSTSRGEFRGRAVNSSGAELMVLTRTAAGWRISAIHWSSRNRRP